MPPGSAAPDAELVERIQALWDDLAGYGADRHDDALRHLLEGLCGLAGAQNATWLGAVRLRDVPGDDPIRGWRPRFVRLLHPTPQLGQALREQEERIERARIDPTVVRNVALAGRLRANRLADLAPPEWFESDYYRRYYLGVGLLDTIWAGCPVSEDAEVYVGLHRAVGHPRYTEAEAATALAALRGLRWFHRQYLLSLGLLAASEPLTPTERRVLQGLLGGRSEKEIAADLGQRPHTTHEHVKVLHRKFGVRSRASLLALWLGKLG